MNAKLERAALAAAARLHAELDRAYAAAFAPKKKKPTKRKVKGSR